MATLCIIILLTMSAVSLLCHQVSGMLKCGSYSWAYADSFVIQKESLNQSAVLVEKESRSFPECCVACAESQGCSGVAFSDGECKLINGKVAAPSFVVANGSGETFKVMLYEAQYNRELEHNCPDTCEACAMDCATLLSSGHTIDGAYAIRPDNTSAFLAYCDMSGGAWTVFQRRVDDSVDFYRGWDDYVAGFGVPEGNVWAGLDNIHVLTSVCATELYVSMETFEGETAWAAYSSFAVGDAASGYLMTVGGYSGTAGNSMAYHNNMKFTTYDHDMDLCGNNCAQAYKGAWWYGGGHHTNPNAQYLHGAVTSFADSVTWYHFKGHHYSLKMIEFKVKCK